MNIFCYVQILVLLCCNIFKATQAIKQQNEPDKETVLQLIHEISTNNVGNLCYKRSFRSIQVDFPTNQFEPAKEKALLAARVIEDSSSLGNPKIVESVMRNILQTESSIYQARVISLDPFLHTFATRHEVVSEEDDVFSTRRDIVARNSTRFLVETDSPWLLNRSSKNQDLSSKFMRFSGLLMGGTNGWWTFPYYSCALHSWFLSFTAPIYSQTSSSISQLTGLLSFDIEISKLDINQCTSGNTNDTTSAQVKLFAGTHKCHRVTSECIFDPGHGWVRGGYFCRCQPGYFGKTGKSLFNGSLVEVAFKDKELQDNDAYDILYECQSCAPGCSTCIDSTPCLANYHWPFRYSLLAIALLCVLVTLILMMLVYSFRRLKVFRLASPTFLCLTLSGCAIMYLEMVAIFPYLDVYFCIATKWLRHLGFLLTYSALLMKTWRVSLTYRVKSAHKLKLTDKQLLQWLFPILLVMIIYLSAWTLSDPPQAVFIKDSMGKKFKQCFYGWWDHSLGLGEFLFLMWGIRVCYNVRKARTHFNEAKLIRLSIYNIAIVNIIMVAIHLIIFPHAGPDMKYFLGFIRTQLSTTVTIALVFGPKFLRVARGTANELDDRIRARGNAASMIEVPTERDGGQKDVYIENEELKEEIQKLAGQIQYLKIVGMLMENRHIRAKKDGYFSKDNCSKHMEGIQHYFTQNGTLASNMLGKSTQPTIQLTTDCDEGPGRQVSWARATASGSSSSQKKVGQQSSNGAAVQGSHNNSGQAVILAEKVDDNSYTLVEAPKSSPCPTANQQPCQDSLRDLLLVSDRLKHIDSVSSPEELASNSLSHKKCHSISCETNSYKDISPSVEPFIPERV